jgi:hypothetical protein
LRAIIVFEYLKEPGGSCGSGLPMFSFLLLRTLSLGHYTSPDVSDRAVEYIKGFGGEFSRIVAGGYQTVAGRNVIFSDTEPFILANACICM